MRFGLLLVFAITVFAGRLNALTVNASYSGANGSVSGSLSMTYNAGNNTMNWSRQASGTVIGSELSRYNIDVAIYRALTEGGAGVATIFDLSIGNTQAVQTGSFTPVAGSWYQLYIRVRQSGSNTVLVQPITDWMTSEEEGPPTYGITLKVPANMTIRAVLYMAIQNGQSLGSYTQVSGASAADWYIGNLPTNDTVHLVEITGGFVTGNLPSGGGPGGAGLVEGGGSSPETEYKPVAPGVAPTTETSPGSGASATTSATPTAPTDSSSGVPPVAPPAAPTAPTSTAAPSAPTSTAAPTAPTATSQPTPTGADPAKKEDIMASANQITGAVDKVAAAVADAGAKGILATDKVAAAVADGATKTVLATDKVSTAVWDSGSKIVTSLTTTNKTLGEINTRLGSSHTQLTTIVSHLGTTNAKLDEIKAQFQAGPDRTADTAAANASYASAQAASGPAQTAASGSLAVMAVPSINPEVPGNPDMNIVVPGIATFSVDPASNSTVAGVIAWVKAVAAWFITLSFLWWTWGEFLKTIYVVVNVPQAKGNPVVGGTGAQVTALISAAAISAILLTVPVAFTAALATPLGTSLSANPFAGVPTAAGFSLYYLYLFLPMPTIIAALYSAFLVRKAGAVIVVTVAAAIRFVTP